MKKKIVLIGIDGSGKTSAAIWIRLWFLSRKQKCNIRHYSPLLFDFFKVVLIKITNNLKKSDDEMISGLEGFSSKYPSPLMVLLSFVDNLLSLFIDIFFRNNSETIVFDRYYYDYIINFMNNVSPKIIKIFIIIIPPPDIIIFLDITPEIAFERKKEGVFNDYVEITKRYRKLAYYLANKEIIRINAGNTFQMVTKEIDKELKRISRTQK